MNLLETFTGADNDWHAELVKVYGDAAGHFRYSSRGRGEPDSPLRAAFDARQSAARAWLESRQ